ncbi:MAG: hypothetical protein QOE90_1328 [Thermoplasmata archaeon]|jgi:hypothetical protein|nr:hypothetical protein [Thermoplasmata archaeon]
MLKRLLQGVPSAAPAAGIATAIALVAAAAVASMVVSYPTPAAATLSLRTPPVVWSAGPDSSATGFASSWSLSSNATYFTLTLKPIPEANVTWGNLTSLTNQDTAAWTVTVSGTSVASYSKIVTIRLEFYAYGTNSLVGAMNLTAGSPSVSLGSLAAGSSVYAKMYVQLATGTSASDLPASVDITLGLS